MDLQRADRENQDFEVTLIAVLTTPAIILARAIKSWMEGTGTTTISVNACRIDNVRSAGGSFFSEMRVQSDGGLL
jgi:hypothetical protein